MEEGSKKAFFPVFAIGVAPGDCVLQLAELSGDDAALLQVNAGDTEVAVKDIENAVSISRNNGKVFIAESL